MSDFVDIIIRAQDLAGPQIAKVAAELEAFKLAASDSSSGLDELSKSMGKLQSGAPNLQRTLDQFEKLDDDVANAKAKMAELNAEMAKFNKNRGATASRDIAGLDASIAANRRKIEATKKAAAALEDIQKRLGKEDAVINAEAERRNELDEQWLRNLQKLKTETRSISSSLRGEGLGAFGEAFANLAQDMERANFTIDATRERVKLLREDFKTLDGQAGFEGVLDKFDRVNDQLTETNIRTLQASAAFRNLENRFKSTRGELSAMTRDLRAIGADTLARDIDSLLSKEASKFQTLETIQQHLAASIVKAQLDGRDDLAGELQKRLERTKTEAFQAEIAVDKTAHAISDARKELTQFGRGLRPLSDAGIQFEHLRETIEGLNNPLGELAQKAREFGARFTKDNFPNLNDAQLEDAAKDAEQLAHKIEKVGQESQNGSAQVQVFERNINGLRTAFSRLGAKNVAQDLRNVSSAAALGDFNRLRDDLKGAVIQARQLKLTPEQRASFAEFFRQARTDLEHFASDVQNGRLQLVQFERDTEKVGRSFASAGFPILGAQLDKVGNSAFRSSEGLRRMATETERLSRQAANTGLEKQANQLDIIGRRLVTAANDAERLEQGLKAPIRSFEGFAARAERVGSKLGLVTSEMERLKAATAGGNGVFGIFIRTLTVWASRMAILVFAFTGLTGVIGPLVGTVGSLVGGVTSLVAAFSQLSGVLAGIPGALAAVGGSMLAIRSVLQPQGILTAVQGVLAAQKSQSGSVSSTGGSTAGNPVRDARRAVVDAQQSLADAEQNLHDLRITDRNQEQDAELALQKARLDAAQANIQAERDLIAVRREAKLQEDELRADVLNAKSSLSGLQQEGASPAAILAAQSDVRSAESALAHQQIEDAKDVGDAQQKVHDARVNGALAVEQAERALATTIRNNSRQERDAQQAVARAMRGVADAQENVAKAMRGAGGAASTFGSQMQRALAGLDPAARRLVFQIVQLRNAFQILTRGVRDRGYAVFSQFVSFLQAHLPQIVAVLNQFATAVTDVAAKFFHFIESPKVFQQIQDLFINSVPLVEKFGQVLIPLVDIFIKIGNAALPFTNFLADGAVKIANFFDKLTTASIKSGGFAEFLQHSEQTLTVVVNLIRDLAGLFKNLFTAAAPAGRELLRIFDGYVQSLETATGSVKGQNNLKQFFEDQIPVMRAVGRVLAAIGSGLIDVTQALSNGPKGQNTLVDFLDRLSTGFIPFLVDFLTKFSAGVGTAFVNLIAAFGNLALAMASLSEPGTVVINTLAGITQGAADLINFMNSHVPGLTNLLTSLAFSFLVITKLNGPLTAMFTGLGFKSKALGDGLNLLYFRFKLLFAAFVVLQELGVPVVRILGDIADAFSSAAGAVDDFLNQFGPLRPVLTAAGDALKVFGAILVGIFVADQIIGGAKAIVLIIDGLLVKLGLLAEGESFVTGATARMNAMLGRSVIAQEEAAGAATIAAAAYREEAVAIGTAQTAQDLWLPTSARTAEKAAEAEKKTTLLGRAFGVMGKILKFAVIPLFAFFSGTILTGLIDALGILIATLAVALGISVGAAIAIVAALGIVILGLTTNMFGFRDAAEAVVGDVAKFFGGLQDDISKLVFHGDFSGFVDDAKSAGEAALNILEKVGHALSQGGTLPHGAAIGGRGGGAGVSALVNTDTLLPKPADVKTKAVSLGRSVVLGFLDGTQTLKGSFPAQFENAMTIVKEHVARDLQQIQSQFSRFSSTVGIILGSLSETTETPAERKLRRLQTEDERRALQADLRNAKTASERAAARRALEEFNLQQRARVQRAGENIIQQVQSQSQQAQLESLQTFLENKNVSWQEKEEAINRFLKKNNLTRLELEKHYEKEYGKAGKKIGDIAFKNLMNQIAPFRRVLKNLQNDVNIVFGATGNDLVGGSQTVRDPRTHRLLQTPGGTAAADAAARAKQLGGIVAQFGKFGDNAANAFGDSMLKTFRTVGVTKTAASLASVIAETKKTLKTGSPSKVYIAFGKDVVDGFIIGLTGLRRRFIKVFAGIGSDTAGFFVSMADFIKGKNGWGAVTKVFAQTVPATFPGIRNTIQKLWNGLLSDHDTFWNKFEKRLAKGWASIHDTFTKTIPGSYDSIAKAIGGLWTRLGHGVDKGWKYITSQLFSWESDLLDTMNLILKRVGGKKLDRLVKPSAPQGAAPTDFASGGVPFVGNYGHGIVKPVPGGVYRVAEAGQREAIISLDRRHRNRSLQIIEFALGNLGIPGFASGGITDPGKSESRFGGLKVGDTPTFDKVSGIVKQIAVAAATLVKNAADKWFSSSIMGGIGGPVPEYAVPSSAHIQHNIALGQELAASKYGWTGNVFNALRSLWIGESGWNEFAYNRSSGAQGIPQFLPGLAGRPTPKGFPSNPPVDPKLQELWGMGYIHGRYNDPLTAFRLWLSRSPHWYHEGTPSVPGPKGADVPAMLQAGEMVLTQKHQALLGKLLFGNFMPNPPGGGGLSGGSGSIHGHFAEMAAYFKKLLAAVFKEVRGYLGAGSMPDFSIASGNFYSRTALENGKGVIPIARRHMEFSHKMVRDVFNNSSYGLGAMLHELAHAFQLPSIIKRGKNWIEGGAELFMDRFGPRVFANLGPEHPAERRQYHDMLEAVQKEKALVKRTTVRLKDGSLTNAEKTRLTKQLKREKNHLGNLQDKAKLFLQNHPSANRKFHKILFHLAQAQVPAYERDLAGLRQEFDGDPSAVTKNQFHGGAAAALAKRLSLLDFQRLTKINEVKTTKAEINRIAATGTDASSQQVLANLQAILARLNVNVANLLRTEMAFMAAHPILRKQFPKLYRQLLGIDGGGGGSTTLPLPGPIGGPVLPSFRAGGEVTGYSRRFGDPVTIQAHVGEWVVNPEQQARLAATLGGWQEAKRFLFSTVTPDPMRSSFAVGGPIAGGRGTQTGHGTTVNQHVTINTASPKADIDYVSRVLEARMGRF